MGSAQLLDLDGETHRTILELLPAEDLCALSCTCRQFLRYVSQGSFAEQLWKRRFQEQVGEGLLSLHQAGIPHRLPPTARYWQFLCKHSICFDHIRWWKEGTDLLQSKADEADSLEMSSEQAAAMQITGSMKSRLARSGQCAVVIRHLLMISGGILRDGGADIDIVLIDLNTMDYILPQMLGTTPITRFRHSAVAITPEPNSRLASLVERSLQRLDRQLHEGSVVLIYGGYNTMGQEFGVDHFEACWVSHDGRAIVWLPITSKGHAPSARFHHTANAFDGGRQLVLYGGEGHELIDGTSTQGPAVYLLDISSLAWRRQETHFSLPEHSPGVRSLHIATVRQSPQTGHEELIVLAGYCQNVLAPMHPHRLDLATFEWVREPGLVPNPQEGDLTQLPTPRQRTAAERIGSQWLLMLGGSPTQFLQGSFLDDMLKLHLPSLTWRRPPQVHGKPLRALRRIAGHSLEGLLAFGGCIPTIMGIMPVAKTDPLLLGPEPPLDMFLAQDPTMTQPAFLHEDLTPCAPTQIPIPPENLGTAQELGAGPSSDPSLIPMSVFRDREGPYTAWRVPGPSREPQTEMLRLAPIQKGRAFWRNEKTGQFYVQNENGHRKLSVLEPIQGPGSVSSETGSSPRDFNVEEDLHQQAGPQPPQDQQGPCLMQ